MERMMGRRAPRFPGLPAPLAVSSPKATALDLIALQSIGSEAFSAHYNAEAAARGLNAD
jgi:hypothetical protein